MEPLSNDANAGLAAAEVLSQLRAAGFTFASGVPCSYLTPLLDALLADPAFKYVPAANEGDAVAIGAGAELGGRPAVVLFQNSGLGNAVSPLTSLTDTFAIPLLLIITWRGEPGGAADEPQHERMGAITPALLGQMGIVWERLPADAQGLAASLDRARRHLATARRPFAWLVSKGAVAGSACAAAPTIERESAGRIEGPAGATRLATDTALGAVQRGCRPDDVVIATTGYSGRALAALDDRAQQFYMVGSMGCASSLGLGLALARPERRVVVVDGDGAMLMRMGVVATIGHLAPRNLVHVLLDNGVHDSTGAQPTVASAVDLAGVAAACGYSRVIRVADVDGLQRAVREADGLTFLHVRTSPRGGGGLPRPRLRPVEVAQRLRAFLGDRVGGQ